MKRWLSLLLTLTLVLGLLSPLTIVVGATDTSVENKYKGKVISIMGDSISTFEGYIPDEDGFNLKHYARYPQDNLLTDVNETWWMQVLMQLDAKLGINESWRSTEIYNYINAEVDSSTYDGTKACMASTTRIQNLGANGTPDVILFYGGTNDITQGRPVGTFDPATAPTEVDLTSVKWDTVADAYVDAIMRMQYYYPDAMIVAMFPAVTSKNTVSVIAPYTEMFTAVCDHYGVTHLDLRDSGVTKSHLPDGTHPDAEGMDLITAMVLDALNKCEIEAGETIVHSLTTELDRAKSSRGYYKGVTHGKPYTTELSGIDLTVSVKMGGEDVTAAVYENGVVTIPQVTGDVVITATGALNIEACNAYLQPLPEIFCCKTNLWTVLTRDKGFYNGTKWGTHSSNDVHSVTIPVKVGDRIWATSFQNKPANGNATTSSNGIRVTWFNENGVMKSVIPATINTEFKNNGYITVPNGALVANIPMWNNNDTNELYILNRDHSFKCDKCSSCGEVDPTAEHAYDNACDTTCNVCDNIRDVPDHVYDNGCDTDCNVCGATRSITHKYTNACDKSCNVCGTTRTVPAHKYSYSCDKTCNVCGATRSITHKYTNACDKSCNVCGTTRTVPAHKYGYSCDKTCNVCGATRTVKHTYSSSCDTSCNVCGTTRTVPAHKYSHSCDKTCNVCGATRSVTHKYTNTCDTKCNVCSAVRTISHKYKTTTTKATLTKSGSIVKKCSVCGKVASNTAIKYPKTFTLSATSYTYNGAVKKPTVTVKDSAGKTISSSNYTVTYATGRKNVGTYKVTVKMKGNYTGTKTLTFKINPAKTTVSKVTPATKSLKVSITKKSTQVTGYQIQYSTSKSFTSPKTKTITSYKTTSTTISSLKAKTTYYVRVRTYKTVSGVKYYSGWSTAKSAKTK